jgi:anti-sigma B factor antagonist
MLTIQSSQPAPDIALLEITGRIAMGRECKELEWATQGLLKNNVKKVVFDLTRVTHVDSTGIGIIVMCAGLLKESGGQLRVVAPSGHIEHIFKMTNVDQIVGLHPSVAAATAGF